MPTPPQRPRPVFSPDVSPAPKPADNPTATPGVATPSAATPPAPPLPGGKPRPPFAPGVAAPSQPVAPTPVAPEVPSNMTPRQAAAANAEARTPKVKPYNGSCPACGHGSMFPLVRYYETDVNENPTADAIMPNRVGAMMFPGISLVLLLTSWMGSMAWDKNKVAKGRAKVKKARAEVLPRCPQAVICPRCQEVLERF